MIYFRAVSLLTALLLSAHSAFAAVPEVLTKIPFELRSQLPTAKISVGGKAIPLFIDLGGYLPISLTKGALRQVTVNYTGTSDKWKDSTGTIHESKRFVAPNVVIAGTSFGDVQGAESLFPESPDAADPKGYIGFGLLKKYLLVFDYVLGVLRLYPSGDPTAIEAECGSQHFPIQVVDGVVQTVIDTDKGKLIFQWDTGSTRNVIRPSSIGEKGTPLRPFRSFQIGEKQLTASVVFEVREFAAPAVDGVLGTDFFASRVVCFDVKTGRGAIR